MTINTKQGFGITGILIGIIIALIVGVGGFYAVKNTDLITKNINDSIFVDEIQESDELITAEQPKDEMVVKDEPKSSIWNDIVAQLDRNTKKTDCYPFYLVDLYAQYANGEEIMIYNNLKICDLGGTFKEGSLGEEGYLYSKQFIMNSLKIGDIITNSFGDAGYSSMRNIFIPYAQPNLKAEISTSWSEGSGPSAKLITQSKEYQITITPPQYSLGSCKSKEITILLNNTPVWKTEGDSIYSRCVDEVFILDGVQKTRINYKSGFRDFAPSNKEMTKFSLSWGSLEFCFELSDTINTFRLCGKG